jgi:predicted DNA-binding protein (MmcQ/YjbR family)
MLMIGGLRDGRELIGALPGAVRRRRYGARVTPDELRDWCLSMPGAIEDFPFAPGVSVFKVGGKMFALSMLGADPLTVSVKCDPVLAESLRNSYRSIVPGYHLNKRHWLTITLNDDAADGMVRDLVQDSYDLVRPKRSRRQPAS